jgi:hypothetical protein
MSEKPIIERLFVRPEGVAMISIDDDWSALRLKQE